MRIILLLLACCTAFPLYAGGSKEKETKPKPVTIEGVVRLVGNEPFTRLTVTTKEGRSYFFDADKKKTYGRFIGLLVTVQGTVEEKQLVTADGKALGIEYLLKDAEVTEARPRDSPK